MIVPLTMYETVQALGYHHLGHPYTTYHRVVGERALKERALTRKASPGLRLAHHSAFMLPLLRAPTRRRQAAPKAWVPSVVPMYPAEAVIGAGWPRPP